MKISTSPACMKQPYGKVAMVVLFFMLIIQPLQSRNINRRIASVPFQMAGNYVVVSVRINDSSPMKLILDTGIKNTIITELQEGDRISLNYSDVKDLMGLGTGTGLNAYISNYNSLKIGRIKLDYKTVFVLKNDVFNLSKYTGMKINGLLGSDIFLKYIVEIDYTHRRLEFFESLPFEKPEGYEALPFSIEGQKFFIDVPVMKQDSSIVHTKMLIDTGAELNAWFRTTSSPKISIPPKWIEGNIGHGLNGIITGKFGYIPEIFIGSYCFKNPVVCFPDSAGISGILNNTSRDGTIGCHLLKRFNLIIDFDRKMLYIKPNSFYSKRFGYNVAGIEISQITNFLPLIQVISVWKNSPAEKAGVLPDDQLIEIEGRNALQMTLDEIRKIFQTPLKHPLHITLRRGNEEIEVKLDMRDRL